MRRLIRLIARLYPAHWRQRYGPEFDALLEDATPTWRNTVDVGWGALEMHMSSWRFPKLAVVCAAAGAILAAAVAIRMPDRYISEAVIHMTGDAESIHFFPVRVIQPALNRKWLGELIQKNDLYATDRRHAPLENVIERMRQDINITIRGAHSGAADPADTAFVVRYVYRDPVLAQRTANELVSRLIETNLVQGMGANQAELRSTGARIEMVSPANLPRRPVQPKRFLMMVLGASAGLTLAALTAMAVRLQRAAAQT